MSLRFGPNEVREEPGHRLVVNGTVQYLSRAVPGICPYLGERGSPRLIQKRPCSLPMGAHDGETPN